jgi:hypothetical protein
MTRTKYMQTVMNETYPGIAIEAIKNGFEGAWDRLIAERLLKDYNAGNSEAECIIEAAGGLSMQKRMQAAKLITSSKIMSHDTVK